MWTPPATAYVRNWTCLPKKVCNSSSRVSSYNYKTKDNKPTLPTTAYLAYLAYPAYLAYLAYPAYHCLPRLPLPTSPTIAYYCLPRLPSPTIAYSCQCSSNAVVTIYNILAVFTNFVAVLG